MHSDGRLLFLTEGGGAQLSHSHFNPVLERTLGLRAGGREIGRQVKILGDLGDILHFLVWEVFASFSIQLLGLVKKDFILKEYTHVENMS